jgi:hypothetical protein
MKMRRVLTIVLLVGACGGTASDAIVDVPADIRYQLHAISGHAIEECVDLRTTTATIEITVDGFEPECAIVTKSQSITIRNAQPEFDTWIVADPENNLVPRHIRLMRELESGATEEIARIGEWAPTGVWPCYGRESRHQCRLVIVP